RDRRHEGPRRVCDVRQLADRAGDDRRTHGVPDPEPAAHPAAADSADRGRAPRRWQVAEHWRDGSANLVGDGPDAGWIPSPATSLIEPMKSLSVTSLVLVAAVTAACRPSTVPTPARRATIIAV